MREGAVDGVACPGWECVKGRVKAQAQAQQQVEGEGRQGEVGTNGLDGTAPERGEEQSLDDAEVGNGGVSEEIPLELVRQVVGDELAERYNWLKEKKRVENGTSSYPSVGFPSTTFELPGAGLMFSWTSFACEDPSYTMCPLQHCQSPVPPPPRTSSNRPQTAVKTARIFRLHQPLHGVATGTAASQETDAAAAADVAAAEKRRLQAEEDLADRFRQCPTCQFSFCRFCNKTWHGTSPCPLPSTASFLTSYMATPPDSPAREAFEKRYGKKQLTRMVAEWVEQRANADWFEKHTRACAGCGTRVNKSAGCNHMICSKCAAHFCYRCGTKVSSRRGNRIVTRSLIISSFVRAHVQLRPADPYHHYRTPGSSCFEKLFDAAEIARFEREVAGDPAGALEGGFEDDLAFGMGVQVDGWVEDVFPLQGNGGWW